MNRYHAGRKTTTPFLIGWNRKRVRQFPVMKRILKQRTRKELSTEESLLRLAGCKLYSSSVWSKTGFTICISDDNIMNIANLKGLWENRMLHFRHSSNLYSGTEIHPASLQSFYATALCCVQILCCIKSNNEEYL